MPRWRVVHRDRLSWSCSPSWLPLSVHSESWREIIASIASYQDDMPINHMSLPIINHTQRSSCYAPASLWNAEVWMVTG
jgi:hypothetical protein